MNRIIFLVGESGCGKTTLQNQLIKHNPDRYCQVKSTVSRIPREGELESAAYHFIDRGQFENLIMENKLLQYVEWGGNYYGTTKKEYEQSQRIGLFVCTPIGIPDTINALRKNGIDFDFQIIFYMTTKKLLKEHNTSQERIDRGNIMKEFLERYTNNEFENIDITFLQDDDIVINKLYKRIAGSY